MPKSETSLKELLYDLRRIAEHREQLTEKKIEKIYKSLIKDLNAYLGEEYIKYADGDGRLFMAQMQEKRHYARFLEEVAARVDSISPQLNREIMGLVEDTYTATYKGMADAVANSATTKDIAAMVEGSMVRPEVVEQSLKNNISKLTLPRVLEMRRQEVIYQIQQELTTGLLNGDRYEKMATRISERVNVSKSKAMNITRTESHRNIESGLMDCAKDISAGIEGSGLFYTATWRTMGDQRVRPQRRTKTKKGWKTTYSKNGANHIKMDGVTIKVGDKFKLESGVYAENPSKSGVARHDCNCRCFIEYDLMTAEEFAKHPNRQVNGKTVSGYARDLNAGDDATKHYAKSVIKEPKITSDLQKAVSQTSGKLDGLDFRLKTEESYKRKVEKEILDINKEAAKRGIAYTATQADAVENMRDVVRYTSISKKETLVRDFEDTISAMEKDGYKLVRVKNTFKKDAPYKGINCILQDPSGYSFELQFHTPQSFELKNGILHELYEKERAVTTPPAEKVKLQKQMKEISDSIVFPDNVDKIKSFNDLIDILDKIN